MGHDHHNKEPVDEVKEEGVPLSPTDRGAAVRHGTMLPQDEHHDGRGGVEGFNHGQGALYSAAHAPHQHQPHHFRGRFATDEVKFILYTNPIPKQRHCPYLPSYVLSHIQVQNGHLDCDGRPVVEYCQRLSPVLRMLFKLDYVVCTCPSYTFKSFVDIYVISSAPLNIVPHINVILPVMMDECGFHTTAAHPSPTTPANKLFEYAFVVGTPGSRAALTKAKLVSKRFAEENNVELPKTVRHRSCSYQPTGPLKIKLCSAKPTSATTFPPSDGPHCYDFYKNNKNKTKKKHLKV